MPTESNRTSLNRLKALIFKETTRLVITEICALSTANNPVEAVAKLVLKEATRVVLRVTRTAYPVTWLTHIATRVVRFATINTLALNKNSMTMLLSLLKISRTPASASKNIVMLTAPVADTIMSMEKLPEMVVPKYV